MKTYKNEFDYDDERFDRSLWVRERATGLSRRTILKSLAAAAATAGVLGGFAPRAQAIVKPIPPNLFRTIGTNRETRFDAFKGQGYLTPASLFFIRNHTDTPVISAATWRLQISGSGVTTPVDFTLEQLKALPSVTLTRSIECAGNGRSFFTSQQGQTVAGSAWRLGAIGVGRWKGVRLSTLLNAAGVKGTAVDVLPQGLDNEVSAAQGRVRRPLPISRALEDDVLVVYELNDEPLPPDHGFPARLLVPGWIGIANIKWLGSIQVFDTPLADTGIQWYDVQYRFGPAASYPGQPRLDRQTIKSAFELPWVADSPAPLPAGLQLLTGRSWSARGTISKVEVSVNDGATWQRATIKPGGNDHQAWAEWRIPWTAQAGTHFLKARAVDNLGNAQPDIVPFNDQGYLFNGIVRHQVNVA